MQVFFVNSRSSKLFQEKSYLVYLGNALEIVMQPLINTYVYWVVYETKTNIAWPNQSVNLVNYFTINAHLGAILQKKLNFANRLMLATTMTLGFVSFANTRIERISRVEC